jgi:hypothetical protein
MTGRENEKVSLAVTELRLLNAPPHAPESPHSPQLGSGASGTKRITPEATRCSFRTTILPPDYQIPHSFACRSSPLVTNTTSFQKLPRSLYFLAVQQQISRFTLGTRLSFSLRVLGRRAASDVLFTSTCINKATCPRLDN